MDDVGIPKMLMMDGASEFTGRHFALLNTHGGCRSSYTLWNREGRIKIMQWNVRLVVSC
jgi:hypothetical protein